MHSLTSNCKSSVNYFQTMLNVNNELSIQDSRRMIQLVIFFFVHVVRDKLSVIQVLSVCLCKILSLSLFLKVGTLHSLAANIISLFLTLPRFSLSFWLCQSLSFDYNLPSLSFFLSFFLSQRLLFSLSLTRHLKQTRSKQASKHQQEAVKL